MGGYCEATAKHGGLCYRRLADPSADRCWMHGGKREPSAAAQLKERDALLDEAMRLLAAACPESEDSLAVFQGWYDDLAALRARIKEVRK